MIFVMDSIDRRVEKALLYSQRLIGIKYGPWIGGVIGSGSPFWIDNELPSTDKIGVGGINCVGLINLISLFLNNEPRSDWFDYLDKKNALEPYDSRKIYPRGTLVLRRYRDIEDQGHVGIIVSDDEILHSYMRIDPDRTFRESIHSANSDYGPGVVVEKIDDSHTWFEGGTYTDICAPEFWM
jgi:cell wall-associated NlpC family hydrolase